MSRSICLITRHLLLGLLGLLSSACQNMVSLEPAAAETSRFLPLTIEYNASEGTLERMVYRSTFQYDQENRLLSITDSLLSLVDGSPAPYPASRWAEFSYQGDQLKTIQVNDILISGNSGSVSAVGRFELSYAGDVLKGERSLNGTPGSTLYVKLKPDGFPVNTSVQVGELWLDEQGHLDYKKQSSADGQVLDQRYDQDRNIFSDSKAYQLLWLLQTAAGWSIRTSMLDRLNNALISNNLIYQEIRSCQTAFGVTTCAQYKNTWQTLATNPQRYPTRRVVPLGPMGRYQCVIRYKQVK